MEVKTAELKAKLSQYLKSVREDGASYVVLDRKTPVALLTPLANAKQGSADVEKVMEICREMEAEGFGVSLPVARDRSRAKPKIASDGRTDVQTIDLVRGERDY